MRVSRMKKYLVPVLICLALLATMPGVALAKGHHDTDVKHINATMRVTAIDDTALYQNVFPLDENYQVMQYPFDPADVAWWQVMDRTVEGKIRGKLKGTWEFTYSGLLNPQQAGTIDGSLTITTKKGQIFALASGTTATIGSGVHPRKGPYIDVVFAVDALSIAGGTGKYQGVSGEGYLGGYDQPIRLFLDETGQHVTGVKGKMKLRLSMVFPDDDDGDESDDDGDDGE